MRRDGTVPAGSGPAGLDPVGLVLAGLASAWLAVLSQQALAAPGTADVAAETDAGYPSRPITIIVPYAAGGPSDTLAHLISGRMARTLGQRIVIENIAGAGGTTATLRAKRSAADGYTLSIGNIGTHAAAASLYPRLGYNPRTDFEPLGLIASAPIVVLGRRDFAPKDFREFVDYLQLNSHNLDEAHGGVGSISYDACLLLNYLVGARPRLISYEGASPALDSLMRGRTDYMCDQTINAVPRVRAGKVKAYAVAAPERSPALPDVPTTAEGGMPQFQLSAWQALFAPRGIPANVAERLNDALGQALDDPVVRARMAELGATPPNGGQRTPQALATIMQEEIDRWAAVIKAAIGDGDGPAPSAK